MVDDAQAARPHKVDGRLVEPKRAVPQRVRIYLLPGWKYNLLSVYYLPYLTLQVEKL
jgi:hypothetical protein